MDEGPEPEGGKPGETNSTRLQDGEILSHHRHVAFVEVPEGARLWMAVEHCRNEAADIAALLDRNLRDTRQRSAAPRGGGRIADDEYPRLIRYVRERANTDPTGMVGLDAEHAQYRRGCDPRRPQHRRTLDPLAGDDHVVLIDVFHPCPVMTVTPSFSSRLAAFLDRDSE